MVTEIAPPTAPPATIRDRFLELDLLRFCAAMAVVVYHYKSKYIETLADRPELAAGIYAVTKFGYLGVDLFFLISGFVIFSSALGRTPFQFAVSRVTRIYPTLWVCVTLTALVAVAMRGAQSGVSFSQWAANLTLLNRFAGIPDIDGVYWTLQVEIRFYAMVFLLLAVGLLRHYRVWLTIWLAMAVAFAWVRQPFFMGWFISPEYSAYFISGIVFFLARRDGFGRFHVLMLAACLPLASLYAYQAIDSFARNVTPTDRWIAVAIVCGLYLLFVLVALRKFNLRRAGLVMALGGTTYPLYLLHNVAGKAVFDRYVGSVDPLALLLAITAGVLLASLAVHVYLERRIADRLKRYLFGGARRLQGLLPAAWAR